jgi:hypothetical protein
VQQEMLRLIRKFPATNITDNDIAAFAHVIYGVGHKHGKRNRQEDERFVSLFEFVQEAITKEFPRGLPPAEDINVRQLTKKVRVTVGQNQEWQAKGNEKPINQDTVRRALRALRGKKKNL